MSRSVRDLLPDVRIAAAGVPEFLALYSLTRALSEFLDRSEAWKDWASTSTDFADATGGIATWINHLAQPTQRWMRMKRIDMLRWSADGTLIRFRTAEQLQGYDALWRTRTGTRPLYFTTEGELAAAGVSPSGFRVRLYPAPQSIDVVGSIEPRFVITTDAVAAFALSEFDSQVPPVPDRIFYPFRQGIVSGALAHLYMMPGKDWTNPQLAQPHGAKFENTIADAKSRADRDFGNAPLITTYGGI